MGSNLEETRSEAEANRERRKGFLTEAGLLKLLPIAQV